MRYISIDLSSDNHLERPQIFGGYAGEHNETILQVKLPKRMIGIECSGYRFDFQTSEDNKISSPLIPISKLNNDILSFNLTEQLTIGGKLLFKVVAILSSENTVSLISKTNTVILHIQESLEGNVHFFDPNGHKDMLQQMVEELIKENSVGKKTSFGGEIFNDYENNQANALYSHAEGRNTTASGSSSHAEGRNTTASDSSSHAEGRGSKANAENAHAEGIGTIASGENAHAEGVRTEAKAIGAHSEGADTIAEGQRSHTEGNVTYAKGFASHAEGGGDSTVDAANKQTNFGAFGDFSHSEGVKTKAVGKASHAQGNLTIAEGEYSHAEGDNTIAQGAVSHAEGYNTRAIGQTSHAEGYATRADGENSHAEGYNSTALGKDSHVEGIGTIAQINGSHAEGTYNKITKDTLTNVSLDGVIRAEATKYITKTNNGVKWNLNTGEGVNHYCFSYSEFSVGKKYKLRLTLNASKAATTKLDFFAWKDLNAVADTTQTVRKRVDLSATKVLSLVKGENIINTIVRLKTYPYLAMRFYNKDVIDAEVTLTKLEIVVNEEIDNTIISSIGNGFNEDNRSNAFTAYKDGHAEVGKMGDTNLSVATKEYVDNKTVNITNALKGSASGNAVVVLKDVSPLPHDVKIKAINADESNTLSVKTHGKNLLPYPYSDTTKTTNGITFTDNGDGGIGISGSTTGYSMFYLCGNGYASGKEEFERFLVDGETYTISLNGKNNIVLFGIIGEVHNKDGSLAYYINSTDKHTFTVDKSKYDYYYLRIFVDKDYIEFSNSIIYPQLELGTVSTEYVPYVEPKTYTANADGTLTVPSIYPTMMISAENNAKNLLTGNVLSKPSDWFNSSDGIIVPGYDEFYLSSKNRYRPLILQGSYLEAGKEYVFGVDVIDFTLNRNSPEIYNSYVVCLQYIDSYDVKHESNKVKLDAKGRRQLTFTPTVSGVYNLICFGRDDTCGSVSFTNPQVNLSGAKIECEYNRDLNKAFAELQQAIISLGGNL